MTEIVFVDTNILVYARDIRYPRQQSVASEWLRGLWHGRSGRTSLQVLSEYYITVTRKQKPGLSSDEAWDDVLAFLTWDPQPVDADVMVRAREIERRYRMSWWDAAIVAAAQIQSCTVLLSEDLPHGMAFGALTVRNPFESALSDADAPYAPAAPPTAVALTPKPLHRPRGRPARGSSSGIS
jgi:predicted nucleic acid-binding protein